MRNFQLEASIWYLFTSVDFYEAAARESESVMNWFGNMAVSKGTAGFGRNGQIFDQFKKRAKDFRRGAELSNLGDYEFIHDVGSCIRGDIRGMMEQPLRAWMTDAQYEEFFGRRIGRLMAYARRIDRSLANAMVKGDDSYFTPKPECPGRNHDDDGFPGDSIVQSYEDYINGDKGPVDVKLPAPLPEYTVDRSVACQTGSEVPWTGVWYPGTGLDNQSLTFAIKGLRMQPAFRVVKTAEELEAEGRLLPRPQTIALITTWHPVIPLIRKQEPQGELRAQGGTACPKAGIWQQVDASAAQRRYAIGETMANLGSAYGFTVWQWISD